MQWWKKKNSDFEKLVMLRSQVKWGNHSGNNVFERKTKMFSMQHMRALKIFKPIYTLGIKSWHFRNYRFFCGKCHDFPDPCTNKSRAERRKKEYFFFKVWNQGRVVVILSKTVILGLLPAPTAIIQILSEIFVRMTGPFRPILRRWE